MFDFACKKFSIDDVLKCGFSLTNSGLKVLKYFITNSSKAFSTKELSKKFNLELSTVQKNVKFLYQAGFLFRTQKNKSSGGYVYYYQIKNKEEMKKLITDIMEGWTKSFKKEIDKW
jgi:predicted transcriptional regulator